MSLLMVDTKTAMVLINIVQMFMYIMLLKVRFPQNFYNFMSLFSVKIFEFIPNPLALVLSAIDYDPQLFLTTD
jgi:hypothetical protein